MANIAVLGPKGTFTDEAAQRYFKEGKVGYMSSITAVFEAMKLGKAEYGVVPIENSTEGSVSETLECLNKYDVYIWAEVYHLIQHVLAGVGDLKDVKKIRSHPQAIRQCMKKLKMARRTNGARAAKRNRVVSRSALLDCEKSIPQSETIQASALNLPPPTLSPSASVVMFEK